MLTSAPLHATNHILEIVVAGANLKPVAVIESLGVILDSRLTFAAYLTAVCKACNHHMWALWHIRHLLTHDVVNTLVCSIVGARIDYCNSILYRASTSSITKLQRLQISLARVVMQQPRQHLSCSFDEVKLLSTYSRHTQYSKTKLKNNKRTLHNILYYISVFPVPQQHILGIQWKCPSSACP